MEDVVIVNGLRTATGKFGGSLKYKSASEIGSVVIKGVLEDLDLKPEVSDRTRSYGPDKFNGSRISKIEDKHMDWGEENEPVNIDEVVMGNVLQGGQGQNPARQASIEAGIPRQIPAYTVNKVCGSGMKAVSTAFHKIRSGETDAIIAGGMESMSSAPYVLPKARWGHRMDIDGRGDMKDMMVWDGLLDIFYDYHMGLTAENLAEEYDISREEQDRLAVESQNRALKAQEDGIFKDEIVPVSIRDGFFEKDETPRDTDLKKLADLPPAFKKGGTVTAGNASSISDGAAALLLTSRSYAEEKDLDIMATIQGEASAGVDPQYMGLGPIPATNKLLDHLNMDEDQIDLMEENEAFAAQILATMKEMDAPRYGIDMNDPGAENINPYGSGISLGHPIGCTAARMLVTLTHGLKRREDNIGLASLCIGGGMGISMLIER